MLIKCPECGNDVSPKAVTCPKCGHPLKPVSPQEYVRPVQTVQKSNKYSGLKPVRYRAKQTINKCLLIAFLLGLAYSLYSIVYWSGAISSGVNTAEQLGAGIATVLVMPHLICTILATIFVGLGCFLRKAGFALTGAILYSVALVLFIAYFIFVIIQMILSYIGFVQLRR